MIYIFSWLLTGPKDIFHRSGKTVMAKKTFMKLKLCQPVSTNRTTRRCKAVWNIISDAGGKVGVFNFLSTYPPEPINGFILAKPLGANKPLTEDCVYPRQMYKIAKQEWMENKEVTLEELQQFFPNPNDAKNLKESHPPYNLLNLLFRDDQITSDITQDYLSQYSSKITLSYFRGSDVVSHIFWKYFRPHDFWNVSKKDIARWV